MAHTATSRALIDARRRFFHGAPPPAHAVREPVLRSWERCARLGLDASAVPAIEPMTTRELRHLLDRHESLLRRSRPEMQVLHAEAAATNSIVILTDASGLVLESVGSAEFGDRAARVALRPGVTWAEPHTGTNAIGAALLERAPSLVHGAEHYFEPHRILTCAASPIVGPQGELLGVLDLTGHSAVPHSHALGLVALAVDQIEHRYFDRGFEAHHVVRCHTEGALLGTAREGVLVFDTQGRLAAANRYGLGLLGLDWGAVQTARYGEIFDGDMVDARAGTRLRTSSGAVLHARVQAPGGVRRGATPAGHGLRDTHRVEPVFSDATRTLIGQATRLLNAGIPVVIEGETGTGKELAARRIHADSDRRLGPFVAVNCAALPDSLIESELFGYEEGAFTGARRHGARGYLREAHGGVLLLDEIGDMPPALQARLLRVLQEREVTPLGGSRPVPVDVAVVCATHRNLPAMVEAGTFREDLYYRLAQYRITLPPLRTLDLEARAEIVDTLWRRADAPAPVLDDDARLALASFAWPGNFRQLTATLRAMRVLADLRPDAADSVGLDAVPPEIRARVAPRVPATASAGAASATDAAPGDLRALADDAIRRALDACGGNVSRAARLLGVNRSTIYRHGQRPH
ncbi:MAG: sigma-54-dependent Fis family transcriptional regulator [Vicinamibacterales bacterium]